MNASPETLLLVGGIYLAAVFTIGILASRGAGASPEDYYLAGRGFGSLILFFSVFGTNVTSFVLVGIPGQAYHDGIGVFGANAAIVALGIPLTFYAIGAPARAAARDLGALTPAELYAVRLGSPAVGVVLFLFFTLYTLPYMVTAVQGVGVTVEAMTAGRLPAAAAAAVILAVTLLYTASGGMRATAWTNALQAALFLGFMAVAFAGISGALGGLEAAMARVRERAPALLVKSGHATLEPRAWASWGLAISLTVIAFPHVFVRLLAARDDRALRSVVRVYPIALVCLWLPSVLIGVWGGAEFPGLSGQQSDRIFGLMVAKHLPALVGALGLAGVLAAVMSTLDAQILTVSSMLTRDCLRRVAPGRVAGRDVAIGRLVAVLLAALVYAIALVVRRASVFDIASFSFSGYVTLVPVLFLGLRWKSFNATGAIASILLGNAILLAAQRGWFPPAGFLPVVYGFLGAVAGALAGTALGRRQARGPLVTSP